MKLKIKAPTQSWQSYNLLFGFSPLNYVLQEVGGVNIAAENRKVQKKLRTYPAGISQAPGGFIQRKSLSVAEDQYQGFLRFNLMGFLIKKLLKFTYGLEYFMR